MTGRSEDIIYILTYFNFRTYVENAQTKAFTFEGTYIGSNILCNIRTFECFEIPFEWLHVERFKRLLFSWNGTIIENTIYIYITTSEINIKIVVELFKYNYY